MKGFAPLAPDEELCKRAQIGDTQAEALLISRHLGLVTARAARLQEKGVEREDLIQEGLIGLLTAVRRFNAAAGAKFSTFAYLCISRRMASAVRDAARASNKESQAIRAALSQGQLIETPADPAACEEEAVADLKKRLEESLSILEYKVLMLYIAGFSYLEISKKLDKTFKVVDNAMQRIRKKLK